MAKITRIDPSNLRLPAYNGLYMVDTYRGQLRIRAWPKKRGTPKSAAVREQNDWFRKARQAVKFVPGSQMDIAIKATRHSGLYPADIIMSALRGNLIHIRTDDGYLMKPGAPKVEPIMFQGAYLRLDTNQSLPSSGWTAVSWPLPILNPAGMWDDTQPTRLTIPNGVTVAQFTAGFITTTQSTSRIFTRLRLNGTTTIAQTVETRKNTKLGTITSPPIDVTEGDYIEYELNTASAETLSGDARTFFGATILGAD